MITSDERRAIVARIHEDEWPNGRGSFDSILHLARCLGIADTDVRGKLRGYIVRAVACRIRELCEPPDEGEEYKRGFDEGFHSADDWYVERGDEELAAHGLLRAPRDADGTPILPGALVTHPGTDGAQKVTSVSFGVAGARVCCLDDVEIMRTSSTRHVRDTPELVANDLDELAKCMSLIDNRPAHDRLASLAERLREMGGDAR